MYRQCKNVFILAEAAKLLKFFSNKNKLVITQKLYNATRSRRNIN